MEHGTAEYNRKLAETMDARNRMQKDHEQHVADLKDRKRRAKRAIQHERASIFLTEKYLNKSRRMKVLLKNIVAATKEHNEKVPAKLDIKFVHEMVSRLVQCHLVLSRGYKLVSYFNLGERSAVYSIVQSLEHVVWSCCVLFVSIVFRTKIMMLNVVSVLD